MISAKLRCAYLDSRQQCSTTPISIEFVGDYKAVGLLEALTHQIKFEKHKLTQAQIECLKKQRRNINLQLEYLKSQSVDLDSPIRLLLHRAILARASQNKTQIEDCVKRRRYIDQQIYKLTSNQIYNSNKLRARYSALLQELGFCAKTTQEDDIDKGVEVYEYSGSNEQIIKRASAKIRELNLALNAEIRDIELTYQDDDLIDNNLSAINEK